MATRLTYGSVGCLAMALALAATPGCRKEEQASKEPAKEDIKVGKDVEADTKAAVEAKLAAADALDGNVDKVVSKCPSCGLIMDGTSEQALQTSGYTLHFCSEDCKTRFDEDATKAILALNIPEE